MPDPFKQVKIIELMELFDDEEVTTLDQIKERPQKALDREMFQNAFREEKAGGGMLVEPGFGGVRQGYREDTISTPFEKSKTTLTRQQYAAQQAGTQRKSKARFDRIGKAFIEQDYKKLKTLTRPARIAAGAKDAGGILNASDTALLNRIIFGNDVKLQNDLAKRLGINRKYMIDTYTEALEFTKAGKSKKQSELRLKRLETQKNLFDEILENPNATVKSMAKKFNKTEKEIVKQSSLLLKNVYEQNVVIGKKEFGDRKLKSWLPDDFNTTDDFLDNFSNIKGLRKVQSENIGTLIRDAFGRGQNPKKYTQALAALSEYNKLVNALPKGLKLNLDHPLSKAFLKGSGVSPEKLLYVTPISSDYNRGFKAKLDMAYKNALLNPNKDKKLIKTIENFADNIGVNIGKGSTKKLDFGTTPITKKTQTGLKEEMIQNLKQQNLAKENLAKFKKTKEGRDIIKQIFPKARKVEIPKVSLNILESLEELGCGKKVKVKAADGGRILMSNGGDLTPCAKEGRKKLGNILTKGTGQKSEQLLATQILKAGPLLKDAVSLRALLGPQAMIFYAGTEAGLIGYDMVSKGKTLKEAVGDSLINPLLGPKLKQDSQKLFVERLQNLGVSDQDIGKGLMFDRMTEDVQTLNNLLQRKFIADQKVEQSKQLYPAAVDKEEREAPGVGGFKFDKPLLSIPDVKDKRKKEADDIAMDIQDIYRTGDRNVLDALEFERFQKPETMKNFIEAKIQKDYLDKLVAADRLIDSQQGVRGAIKKIFQGRRGKAKDREQIGEVFNIPPDFKFAGGGIAKLAGIDEGPPPESGPNSQGLQGLMKRGMKI